MYGSKFQSYDLKLDYKDVLIVPRKSNIYSRNLVNLERKLTFPTQTKWQGIPIISSNMDTVTGIESFDVLRQNKYISCFPKHLNQEWLHNPPIESLRFTDNYILSCGVNEDDYVTLMCLIDKLATQDIKVKFICLDIANGYLTKLVDVVKEFRQKYTDMIIVAGNVVTPEATQDLIQAGANIVKCGIGCFTKDTKVLTSCGEYKYINTLEEGESIISGNGKPTIVKRVIYKGKKKVIRLVSNIWNGFTRMTNDHKFLVTHLDNTDIQWAEIASTQPSVTKLLTPRKIQWDLPIQYTINNSMPSRYQLGFLIGTVLQFGEFHDGKIQIFDTPLAHQNIVKLAKILKLLKVKFVKNQFAAVTSLDIIDNSLCLFLYTCMITNMNSKFLATNKSFINGLYDSIKNIQSLNCKTLDIFNWCSLNLHKAVTQDVLHTKNSFTHVDIMNIKNLAETEDVWDIEVECPSHSFIANNCIVHNSGSVCETRIKTGVGYPQLSAVLECAPVAHSHGGYLISDGGIIHPGDIVKAMAAGADFVMLGSLLAGHQESPGNLELNPRDNKWYKTFYGMASAAAAYQHHGELKQYRTAEGKCVKIPYKGMLKNTINDINGGIRSACTYINAENIEQLYKNSEFILVSQTHNTSLK